MDKIIVNALKGCESREDIEYVFSKFEISSDSQKADLLEATMGEGEMFYSNENPTDSQRYELVMQIFLTMAWKCGNEKAAV